MGAMILKGAIKSLKDRMNPDVVGGAPLLGANGVCIISHGSSSATAIFNAVRVACEAVGHHVNEHIVEDARKLTKTA